MSHIAFFRELCGVVSKFGLNLAEFIEEARRIARKKYGVDPNPVGIRNRKVGGVSTYRRLGDTCPECIYAKICYAYSFPSNIHGFKAEAGAVPSLFSAAIGAAFVVRFGTAMRLHTTGGFARVGGDVDREYVHGLVDLGRELDIREPWAWSYTHFTRGEFEGYQQRLSRVGIEVLYSDVPTVGGAVIWDFDKLDKLRALFPAVRWVRCRSQVDHTPCISCMLCPKARQLGIGIVFQPHSGQKGEIERRAGALLLALAAASQRIGVADPPLVHLLDVEMIGS